MPFSYENISIPFSYENGSANGAFNERDQWCRVHTSNFSLKVSAHISIYREVNS